MDRQYFASEPAEANGFTLGGITWTLVGGIAATEKGSLGDAFAAPLGMGVGPNGTTYMSVEGGGGTEMVTWAPDNPQTSLGIYWGSIDGQPGNINSLNISMGAFTLTGTQLATMFGANDGGANSILMATSWLRSPVLLLSRKRRSTRRPMRSSSPSGRFRSRRPGP
jgi:hypothetical protein